jgi:hypothetical protein
LRIKIRISCDWQQNAFRKLELVFKFIAEIIVFESFIIKIPLYFIDSNKKSNSQSRSSASPSTGAISISAISSDDGVFLLSGRMNKERRLTCPDQRLLSFNEDSDQKSFQPGTRCISFFLCKYLEGHYVARTYLFCAIRPEVEISNSHSPLSALAVVRLAAS